MSVSLGLDCEQRAGRPLEIEIEVGGESFRIVEPGGELLVHVADCP